MEVTKALLGWAFPLGAAAKASRNNNSGILIDTYYLGVFEALVELLASSTVSSTR